MVIESLSSGAQGEEVRLLQQSLLRLGYAIDPGEQAGLRFGSSTHAAVAAFQEQGSVAGERGVVNAALAASIHEKAALAPWVVTGRVSDYEGPPLDIKVNDVQLRTRELLAAGVTWPDGRFRIEYTPASAGVRGPNLQIDAFRRAGDSPIAVSAIRFAAGPYERIDLTPAASVLPSELELLESRVPPLLGKIAVTELEDVDIEFLSNAADVGPEPLRAYRAAHRSHQNLPDIAVRHWYAFHRASPEARVEILALQSGERVRRLLTAAVARGYIASEPADALAAAADELRSHAIHRVADMLAPLLTTRSAALDLSSLAPLPAETPTESLPELAGVLPEVAPLLVLTSFEPRLAAIIQEELPPAAGPAAVTAFTEERWMALIRRHLEQGGSLPADLGGDTESERVVAFAASLAAASESLFITQAFASRLAEPAGLTMFPAAEAAIAAEGRFENAVRTNTARFLADTHGFDLAGLHVRDFVARHPVPLFEALPEPDREAVVGQVETMQRMLTIAPRVRQMEALLGAGLDSATQVTRMGEEAFAERFSMEFGGAGPARLAHRTAARITGAAALLGAGLHADLQEVVPRALATAAWAARADVADLRQLFGTADLCMCAECRSQFSPAAYFVDLLEFLDPPVPVPADAPATPLTLLLARRPDLERLVLSCENTHTSLPYVDLVNEVLEAFIANGALGAGDANDTGDVSEAELRALPQFTRDAAYELLAEAVFPFTLPFHRSLEEMRAFLAQLGLSRLELLEAVGVAPPRDIATETLQLSARQRAIIAGTLSGKQPFHFYGYRDAEQIVETQPTSWIEAISHVDSFLHRTGLGFDDLLDLLDARWINPDRHAPVLTLQAPEASPCDVASMRLSGLDENRLDRIHRFLRLRSSQGMTMAETDLVIHSLGGGVLDEAMLDALADATAVRRQLKLSWVETCSLWSDLDVHGSRAGADAYYVRLFGDRTIQSPVDDDLRLGTGGEVRGTNVSIVSKTPLLLAVLQVSAADLKTILGHAGLADTDAISVARLSLLHRYSLLARALKMSVPEIVDLIELSFIQPFKSPAETRRFLLAAEQLRASRLSLAEVDYLLRNRKAELFAPTEAAIESMLVQLEGELARLEQEQPQSRPAATARILSDAFSFDSDAAQLLLEKALPSLTAPPSPLAADFSLAILRASLADAELRRKIQLSCLRVQKAAILLKALSMTAAELSFVIAPHDPLDGWSFARLPFKGPAAPDEGLWQAWLQVAAVAATRRLAAGGPATLLDVFRVARDAAELEPVLDVLAAATGWDAGVVRALSGALALTPAAFRNASRLEAMARAMHAWRTARVAIDDLLQWAAREPDPALTAGVRNAVKARYDQGTWPRVARSISDPLREKRRAALVDYTLQMDSVAAAGMQTPDQLYEYFLIDVSMSPCMSTSRVRQAISSVQLFIQRCQLNLEPGVSPKSIDALRWSWMKNYRVWEANRKIFFFPENWIEPELRDDKSQFFRELEADLIQTDITPDTAEAAFRSYLYKLDEVSRLEICGVCPDGADSFYVFGRTYGQSKQHYSRRWDGTVWSGWERVPVDIQGDLPAPMLLPIVHNRRLYLFWPVLVEKSAGPDDAQLGPSENPREKRPRRYLEVSLAYSEYRQGEWTPKRVSSRSILSSNSLDALRELPPRERHSLRGEVNAITSELTVRLIVEMRVDYEGTVYEPKPSPSAANCVVLDSWTLAGCSGDLVTDGRLTLATPDRPTYQSLITNSPLPTYTDLHGVGYRSNPPEPNLPFSVRTDDQPGEALTPILQEAPASFQVVPAQISGVGGKTFPRFMLRDAFRPFVFQDTSRAYWTVPVPTATMPPDAVVHGIVAGLLGREPANPASLGPQNARLRFEPFWHPHVCAFIKSLNESGVTGLLTLANQRLTNDRTMNRFERVYKPQATIDPLFPLEDVQFDLQSAYGLYNMELFLHAPMLIAARLSREHRFADAQRWYHFLFDPTSDADEPTPDRFWRVLPLRNDPASGHIESLLRALTDPDADPDLKRRAELQVESWRRNPFQPHRIARLRPIAYQKAVFMRYLDNLIAWGDHLFAQDTLESINEATQLYVLAADLLGPRPRRVARHDGQPAPSFAMLRASRGARDVMTPLENELARGGAARADAARDGEVSPAVVGLSWSLAFCVPPNERLLAYWDTVADRLFKIRHCQNLSGIARTLPLFEPPIDPALLVRAAALGIDLSTAVAEGDSEPGHYRFLAQLRKAVELCGELRSFGAALLAALEKKDMEAVTLLRATHETSMLQLTRGVLEQQITEANETLQGLHRTRELTQLRFDFYDAIQPISDREGQHLRLLDTAQAFQLVGQATEIAAGAAALSPTTTLGSAGSMGSPVATVSYGGGNIAASLNAASRAMLLLSSLATYQANRTATLAAWDRRAAEWELQANSAAAELRQIDRHIAAAEIRLAIAERELANHDARVAHAQDYETALRGKYTGTELYSWMASELSGLYFQLYSLAHRAARRAERCFQFERDLKAFFIQPGYWDSRRKGLLAGERLALDLRRMEMAYFDQNSRDHELTRHVSIALHDPWALLSLKAAGHCEFELPEALFDLDHPGHYYRRLKSVSVTIPCITGPYTGVHATLTLLSSKIRWDPSLAEGYAEQPSDPRFWSAPAAIESIVTSHAQGDAGLFELSDEDERYLPFEGRGAIGRWRLEMSPSANAFDLDSVADVVLHVRYTARFKQELRAAAALAAVLPPGALESAAERSPSPIAQTHLSRLVSARHELPDAWYAFLRLAAAEDGHRFILDLGIDRLPRHVRRQKIRIHRVGVLLNWSDQVELATGDSTETQPRYPGRGEPLTLVVAASEPGSEPISIELRSDPVTLAGRAFGEAEVNPARGLGQWTLQIKQATIDVIDPSLTVKDASSMPPRRRLNPALAEDLMVVVHYSAVP
jgi:hypothetical protein